MKKILFGIIIISLALSGCTPASQPKANTDQGEPRIEYADCLTLGDIKTALAGEDLQLIENRKENPAYYQADNVMPAIFNIKDSSQIILIYVFNTIADCKQICPNGGSGWSPIDIPQKENYHLIRNYAAKNVLLIDMFSKVKAQEIKPKDLQVLHSLLNITYSLNGSHRVIYKANGTYWDAQYTAVYYQNWYKDEKDVTRSDQYSKGKWELKYIGSDPESITGFSYEYKNSYGCGGSGRTDGNPLQKTGEGYYFTIWNEGSNIPDRNNVLTINIKCNGKEEALKLRVTNQRFLSYLPNKSWEEFVNGRYKYNFINHYYTIRHYY